MREAQRREHIAKEVDRLGKERNAQMDTGRAIAAQRTKDIARFTPVKYNKGTIEGLFCKFCQAQIAGMIEDERYERVERKGSRTIVHKRLVLGHLPLYREKRLVFDDGSAHITHCCATCLPLLAEPAHAEFAYQHDLKQWDEDEKRGFGSVRWDKVAERQIIRVEDPD